MVVGKVAVLLVAVVEVATILEDVDVKVAWFLEMVRLVAGTRRGLRTEAFTGMSDHFDCWS